MNVLFRSFAWLAALFLAGAPAHGQPGQNIAGIYRGMTTACFSQARSADCRKGFTELIRLADDVDAKRIEWERAAAVGDASAAKMQDGYASAVTQLNRAVADFNRDMASPAVQAK